MPYAIFDDWFFHDFLEVQLSCCEDGIPLKILLIVDNVPGHSQPLDGYYADVNIVFLPPNTTTLLQPVDQSVIANFKKYYTHRTYRQALRHG